MFSQTATPFSLTNHQDITSSLKITKNIQIVARIRPEKKGQPKSLDYTVDYENNQLILRKTQHRRNMSTKTPVPVKATCFDFTKILKPSSTQEEVFNSTLVDEISGLIEGRNSLFFSYPRFDHFNGRSRMISSRK